VTAIMRSDFKMSAFKQFDHFHEDTHLTLFMEILESLTGDA